MGPGDPARPKAGLAGRRAAQAGLAACGCRKSRHPMRPGHTRGSGRRADPWAVPKPSYRRWPGASRSLRCPPVFDDQAAHNTPALDPGSDLDGVARVVLRRPLLQPLGRGYPPAW